MNATFNWNLPPVGQNQKPLAEAIVQVHVAGATNWTELGRKLPGEAQSLIFQDIPSGDWVARVVIVDSLGVQDENPIEVPFAVPFDPPGNATNLTITLS